MTDVSSVELGCADGKGREDFVGQARIGLESKAFQTGDDALGNVQIALACGTSRHMLAKRLFFLNRDFARERFVDQVADRLVTISWHVLLHPFVPAGLPCRDKSLT